MSKETVAHRRGDSYTRRYADFDLHGRYDAAAHLGWLLGLPEFRGRLEHLGQLAANPRRRAGPPWHEQPIDGIDGDLAAIERWLGELRRLGYLLPPKLRSLVAILVRDLEAPIDIPPGRALRPDAVGRLQAICRRKLKGRSPPLSDADRAFLYRQLRTLDPSRVPLVRLTAGPSPGVGGVAYLSATAAALGSWAAHPSQVGYPSVGSVATSYGTELGVVALVLPGPGPRGAATSRPRA